MTSYTNIFGGQTSYPAQVSYRSITLTADTDLQWPVELATSTDVVTWIMNVTASAGPFALVMPAADVVAPGNAILIVNVGANQFTVEDSANNTILTVDAGDGWDLYLTDNSTAAGTWYSIQRGATTSSADAAALAGFGLKAITTTLNQSMPVTERTVDFSPGDTDRAKFFVWTGGAGTVTLPDPATVGDNWFISVRNQGSGALALTPTSGDINGSASISLQPNDSCDIATDGTDYFTVGIGQAATFAFDYTSISVAGTGNYTLTGAELNRIAYNFTGLLTGNREVIVPSTTQQYWVTNATTGAFTLSLRTATQPSPGITIDAAASSIFYCDGTNVRDADTQGLATPIAVAEGGTGATTAATARANLGSTTVGDAVYIAANAAAARTALALGSMATQDATAVAITGGTIDATTATNLSALSELSTDAGAAAGPTADLYRNSASPAASDAIANITFSGKDSGGNKTTYAEIASVINDPTDTTEDGQLNINIMQAGTKTTAVKVALGVQVGAPTDTDKGAGTINTAGELYINGFPVRWHGYLAKSAGYTATAADVGVINFTTAGVTLDLPTAVGNAGLWYTILNSAASGVVTIDPNGAQTLDGLATRQLSFNRCRVTIQSDGANWNTVDGEYLFQTSGQTVTLGGTLTVAHALGVKPDWITIWLVCASAEGNYSVGDEIVAWWLAQNTASQGINPYTDATNVNINQSAVISVLDKSAHTFVNITAAKWTWKIIAGAR